MKIICLVLTHFVFVLLFILTFYDTFFYYATILGLVKEFF